MRKFVFTALSILVLASLILSGCTPAEPETIIQTVEVPVIETVEVQVIETQIVTQEVIVEATPAPSDVTYERSETLYVSGAAWGPPSTWNPFQPGSLANTTGTIGYLYETLFDYDPLADAFIPWLAESGEWADETTYNMTLREGLTWSDGTPLTAEDVKFTFELGQQYAALWFSPIWNYLTGVTAVDGQNLEFTFDDPLYQEWDNYLYNLPIVPKHLWETKTEEEVTVGANENPVGSGAYLYETHSEDRNVWLQKRELVGHLTCSACPHPSALWISASRATTWRWAR
jgi:peptide/nickel transport system substrate-binding protein